MIEQERRGRIVEAMLAAAEQESARLVAAREIGDYSVEEAGRRLAELRKQLQAALEFAQEQEILPSPSRKRAGLRYRPMIPHLPWSRPLVLGSVAVLTITFAATWWSVRGSSAVPQSIEAPLDSLVPTATSPRPVATTAPPSPGVVRDPLAVAGEQWLSAYLQEDEARLAALSTRGIRVSDERGADERVPGGAAGRRWTILDTTVQHHGADAVVTARLIETGDAAGDAPPLRFEAFASQMWTNRGGTWQVYETRIVSAAALRRAFR